MARTALGALPLDRDNGGPLSRQICEALRDRIARGRLRAGDALPPSRALAGDLGVSRSTVGTAYDQLVAEGYATGRRGSGVYVGDIGTVEAAPPVPPRRRRTPAGQPAPPDNPEPFRPGLPDMRLFPYRQWGRTVARTARSDTAAMIRETESFGDPVLRQEIVRHLADWRGIEVRPEQVIVTAGAGDALEITIRALSGAGDPVALEDPGYLPLRSFVRSMGLRPVWMPVDGDRATVPAADESPPPRLTVLTPSHQFPLGGAMPTSRRHAFLNHAEATGGWIVEDDFDSEFRFAGRPIPALASLDRAGRVIYVGSFSKVFSLGLRLGYLVVPEAQLPAFADTLRQFRPKASAALQRPLAAFLAEGEFHRHIRRMRRIYAERYRLFQSMLTDRFGANVTWTAHQAGMQIAVHLTGAADDRDMASRARAAGVVCPALSGYHAGEVRHRGLLMGFCAFDEAEMSAAFDRLAGALPELAAAQAAGSVRRATLMGARRPLTDSGSADS